jgi:AcrR family transcriptional regulator
MTNNRFYKIDSNKRELIIKTALKEFSANGYGGASINRISKSAGLSAGHLYYYFENKEDLYLTVVDYIFKEFGFPIHNCSNSFWDEIELMVKNRIVISRKNEEIVIFINRFFEDQSGKSGDDIERITTEKIQKELKVIFDEGIKQGEIRNDLPSEFLFNIHLSLVLTTNKWILNNIHKQENEEITEQFIKDAIALIKSAISPLGGN